LYKLIALIKALPTVSRQQFIEHYESTHAPLVLQLLPMIERYSRSYVPEAADYTGTGTAPEFDVITELWFRDRAALDAFWERIGQPQVLAAIRADEAHFLVSDYTRMFEVEEFVSASGQD
jgi:uncharacterized protein (TIGR02118 family)